jgi:hypothetical protein
VEVTEAWQYSQEMKAIIGKLVFFTTILYTYRTFLLIEKNLDDLKLTIIKMCHFPLVRKIIIYFGSYHRKEKNCLRAQRFR